MLIKDVAASHLPRLLKNNANDFTTKYLSANDFILMEDLKSCHEHVCTLYRSTEVGDLPNFTWVCDENLIGVNPAATTCEVCDGGVFLGPIIWNHVGYCKLAHPGSCASE